MIALLSVAEIRAVEQAASTDLAPGTLMQRAGYAAAKAALDLIAGAHEDARALVLAGPGNNGGDALELACCLAKSDVQVSVLLFADPARQSPEAQLALQRAQTSGAQFFDTAAWRNLASTQWTIVVDGLFGIGLTRPIGGEMQALIERINGVTCPVLALDVPSGLDADTGQVVGEFGIAVRASHTLTFIADKPGLHTGAARDYSGEVQVAPLDIEGRYFPTPLAWLNDASQFSGTLRKRPEDSHKGSYGDVAVIGGAHGMAGAPILAARAAAYCGAGRVYAAFIDAAPAYDGAQPEIMCRLAGEFDFSRATLVVGPGMGSSPAAHDLLARALHAHGALVLDADALNLIAAEPGLQQILAQRKQATLMTPHPLEAARLLACTSAQVQADRLAAARALAARFHATVVLKGSGSVIARMDGIAVINATGNPGLATAGTGDVLAGVCGALLAQHCPVWEAALAAVWLHGVAADNLVQQGTGPVGLTASELLPALRAALNRLVQRHA